MYVLHAVNIVGQSVEMPVQCYLQSTCRLLFVCQQDKAKVVGEFLMKFSTVTSDKRLDFVDELDRDAE